MVMISPSIVTEWNNATQPTPPQLLNPLFLLEDYLNSLSSKHNDSPDRTPERTPLQSHRRRPDSEAAIQDEIAPASVIPSSKTCPFLSSL